MLKSNAISPFWTSVIIYGAVASLYALLTDGVLRDDAYIFFQYARNWAGTGMLAFNPGEPSYGVTSLAWTMLLTAGTWIYPNPLAVAKIFGVILSSLGAALWAKWIFDRLNQRYSVFAVTVAALLPTIGAGRMVMGMEKSILCFTSALLLVTLSSGKSWRYWLAGVLAGLLILIRPEMLVFVLVIAAYLLYKRRPGAAVKVITVAAAVSVWWPLWLHSRTGSFMPPTRTGKLSVFLPESLGITMAQFEAGSIIDRIGWGISAAKIFATGAVSSMVFLALVGAAIVVAIAAFRKAGPRGFLVLVLPAGCILMLFGMYGFMFPLFKIRYFVWLAPATTAAFCAGLYVLLPSMRHRILNWMMVAILLVLLVPSVKRQISSTAVQQLRRTVAEVANEKTPPGARIALEPIGEFGYYADRYIVDMGGLLDRSTQKYLRNGYDDTESVWQCLAVQRADYLVTYDHDGFLGRLVAECPDCFELVAYVPEQPVRGVRYRLLRIVQNPTSDHP